MTALSTPRTTNKMDNGPSPSSLSIGLKASATVYVGALAAVDATGYVVSGTAMATTGLRAVGVVALQEGAVPVAAITDATGVAGSTVVNIVRGCFKFDNDGSIDQTYVLSPAYIIDDHTVAATDGAGSYSCAGTIMKVDSDGVYVMVGYLALSGGSNATQSTAGLLSATDKKFLDRDHAAVVDLTDASATIAISAGTWRRLPTTVPLTTARTVTLSDAGAVSGDQILIQRQDLGAFALTVANNAGATIATLPGPGSVLAQFSTDWAARRESKTATRGNAVAVTNVAAQTLQVSAGSWRTVAALSGNSTYTIGVAGAVSGSELLITRNDTGAYTIAISGGGTNPATLFTMVASKPNHALIRYDGADWALVSCGASS